MWTGKIVLLLTVACVALSQYGNNSPSGALIKNGLTMQATIWPNQSNSYVGRMSCFGCNPISGDTACTESLPVACIINARTLHRPFYNFYADGVTPAPNNDQSYLEGWTGGSIALTDPVPGLWITSYQAGDALCKAYFGFAAKFAEYTDGWVIPQMNGPSTLAIERTWDWSKVVSGTTNFWGYLTITTLEKIGFGIN
jgi:hypothetical protein